MRHTLSLMLLLSACTVDRSGTAMFEFVDAATPGFDAGEAPTRHDGGTPRSRDAGEDPGDDDAAVVDAGVDAGGLTDAGADAGGRELDPELAEACALDGIDLLFLDDLEGSRALLFEALGTDSHALIRELSLDVCRVLYRSPEDRIPARRSFRVEFRGHQTDVATAVRTDTGVEVAIDTAQVFDKVPEGGSLAAVVRSLLVWGLAVLYQHDDYGFDPQLFGGISLAVRYWTGHPPSTPIVPTREGRWNDSAREVAFFLFWLEERFPDFTYEMNQRVAADAPWTADAFVRITASSADQLWSMYQGAP